MVKNEVLRREIWVRRDVEHLRVVTSGDAGSSLGAPVHRVRKLPTAAVWDGVVCWPRLGLCFHSFDCRILEPPLGAKRTTRRNRWYQRQRRAARCNVAPRRVSGWRPPWGRGEGRKVLLSLHEKLFTTHRDRSMCRESR